MIFMRINLNKKSVSIFSIAAASALALSACSPATNTGADDAAAADAAVKVSASFYPVAWLTEQIGGSTVAVTPVTPDGVEPHEFELAPADVDALSKADLVVYVNGFQPSLDDAVATVSGPVVLDLADQVDLEEAAEGAAHDHHHGNEPAEEHEGEHAHEHEGEHADGHSHGDLGLDPHFWLDPVRMKAAAAGIKEALSEADKAHAAVFEKNYGMLIDQLDNLDRDFAQGLEQCKLDTFVTSHSAFGYLAERYHLTQASISGIDPESEPSPADLAAVKKVLAETGTTTIFTEELVSPKTAEAVAAEAGATTAMLSPMESKPEAGNYIDGMKANLEALRTALQCK